MSTPIKAKVDYFSDALIKRAIALMRQKYKIQGHYMTGRLGNSIEGRKKYLGGFDLEAQFFVVDYGVYVQHGVKANRIPFSPTKKTGRKTSLYIQGLMDYAAKKLRIASPEKRLSFAIATARKHKKEDMPTRASYRYSKNGKRTGFMTVAENEAQRIIRDVFIEMINQILNDNTKWQ